MNEKDTTSMVDILVDPEDSWLLTECRWHLNQDGYARGRPPGLDVLVFLHHCIVGYPIWEGEEVDHINRVKTDNRRCNLRYVDRCVQMQNRDYPTGATREKNITQRPYGKYKVQIYRNKQAIYLGDFATLDEAVAERNKWLNLHTRGC